LILGVGAGKGGEGKGGEGEGRIGREGTTPNKKAGYGPAVVLYRGGPRHAGAVEVSEVSPDT